jgi:hypothetical protein
VFVLQFEMNLFCCLSSDFCTLRYVLFSMVLMANKVCILVACSHVHFWLDCVHRNLSFYITISKLLAEFALGTVQHHFILNFGNAHQIWDPYLSATCSSCATVFNPSEAKKLRIKFYGCSLEL